LAEVELLASHVGIIGQGRLLFEGSLVEFLRRHRMRAVVETDRPDDALRVLRAAGCNPNREGSELTIDVADRSDVARVAAALISAGLAVYQLQTAQPSLEELFLGRARVECLVVPHTYRHLSPLVNRTHRDSNATAMANSAPVTPLPMSSTSALL
jgi:ABC-type uncharacterized transport system ATPase subunit